MTEDPQVTRSHRYGDDALEGLAKSAGTHAAGVVIADKPLIEYVPLQKLTGKTGRHSRSGPTSRRAGLLKMDFLGSAEPYDPRSRPSRTSSKHRGNEPIVPYQTFRSMTGDTFALLQRGETKGIFQLESWRDAGSVDEDEARQAFADIIATSALYRPGPTGRRHGDDST